MATSDCAELQTQCAPTPQALYSLALPPDRVVAATAPGCNLHRNAKTMKLALLAPIGAAAAIHTPTQNTALRYRGGAEDDDDSLFGGDDG